eukprot:CAMPEP_0194029502 /NCGR_PEP_ID=MMETSP0009_2-20130614/3208_1 /TAXON_ID=210454 /ORGANISM="Grammatophora oceanica, Strain CCMP 410" /LENGTH=419 /DNA_ID=CAMNT_0038669189 /DNA_START=97 /DNA_END=1356 /DNA_ORIENTATION=-
MVRVSQCLLSVVLFVSQLANVVLANRSAARDVRIINEAGFKIELYWINRWENDELVLNSEEGVFHGAETLIKSFVSHEFEIHELPSKKTGKCGGQNDECRKGYFQVREAHNQIVTFKNALAEVDHIDDATRARDKASSVLAECKEHAQSLGADVEPDDVLKQMMTCVGRNINATVDKTKEEYTFQETLRNDLGSKLVDYACLDPNMTHSDPVENTTWSFDGKRQSPVQVMIDRPYASIHYIKRFITDKECDDVTNAIKMERVEGANGLFAMKGGVEIPLDEQENPITKVANKMYSYATQMSNLESLTFPPESFEKMFALEYSSETKDHYDPHCDGACDGSKHKKGNRVASVIAYCEVPKEGGATHFKNAGIHIVPEKGSALFYSYIDPLTEKTDPGYTSHAGCTVSEGTKRILTHKLTF